MSLLPSLMCVCVCSVWAGVELTVPGSVEVYLGDSAQISCQYSFTEATVEPSFLMIQWFVRAIGGGSSRVRIFYGDHSSTLVDKDTNYTGRIQVTLDQHGTSLSIQGVQLSDEREFFCQVNGLSAGTAEGKTQLRVFAPPEAPVIEVVQEGTSVTREKPSKVASCETRNGFPKPNITWYRNQVPLTPATERVNVLTLVTRDSRDFYSVQSTLEYRVQREDKDAHFSCEVTFSVPGAVRTAESSSINITVHYPPTMVELWKQSPQGLVREGDTVELRCQGDGNPPPTFIFTREQEPDVALESSDDVLTLSAVSRSDSGMYQCRPTQHVPEVKGEMQLTVHYLDSAVMVPKDSEVMFRGEDLVATCNALSSLKTSTLWFKDGRRVGEGHTLHLRDATYETTGEYVCDVTVPSLPSLRTNGSIHIVVQGPPQVLGAEQQLEAAAGRTVNLSCEALGRPAPVISWNIEGSQTWYEVMSQANDQMTLSVVAVSISADISARCNASNVLGSDSRTFRVTAAEGSGLVIIGIVLCLLLLAVLGSVLYFLHKKGKVLCGRSAKEEITKEKTTKNDIVVEMKTKTEDAVLLKSVNGGKRGLSDQESP
ncbi:LOW QUALITY PROTEIN: cell surface glycoprotein MUC18-like [Lampetra planeri]